MNYIRLDKKGVILMFCTTIHLISIQQTAKLRHFYWTYNLVSTRQGQGENGQNDHFKRKGELKMYT